MSSIVWHVHINIHYILEFYVHFSQCGPPKHAFWDEVQKLCDFGKGLSLAGLAIALGFLFENEEYFDSTSYYS